METWTANTRVKNKDRKWYEIWKPRFIWIPLINK